MRPADTAGFGPVGTNAPRSQVDIDHSEAREAADLAVKIGMLRTIDLTARMKDAYTVGYLEGMRAERKRQVTAHDSKAVNTGD